nr:uncharacterized mitochondrial protein AtMg00810-like [Tanacetum cinerariifolium]
MRKMRRSLIVVVLEIYDKKNRVLFTDTECLVLSKDFKLLDDSMVVLRVPRKHNLYTINLNNLCPTEHKDETYPILKDYINLVENQLNKRVIAMRCDNGTEFKNTHIIELCGSKGIKREYSNSRTPQQNKVAERKNRTLIEAARTMLADSKLPTMFWTEAVRTACYVLNRVLQRPDGMFISQDKYVQEILNKFDLGSVRTATTPYEAPKSKSKNESDSPVNVHLYRSVIGSLMYLTALRPDIMFAVSACSRNQVTHTTSNLKAVKKIKYLKGQPKLGLWYPRESPFVLEAYSDSDYAGVNKDRKSTTGGCQFMGRRLISWQCKKQTIVATSSTEAEYVAAANCYGQVLWIKNQLLDYGIMVQEGGLVIFKCSTWTRWSYFDDKAFIL